MKVITKTEWKDAMKAINTLQQFFSQAEAASLLNLDEAEQAEYQAGIERDRAEEVEGAPMEYYDSYYRAMDKAVELTDSERELNSLVTDMNGVLEEAENLLTCIKWNMGFED